MLGEAEMAFLFLVFGTGDFRGQKYYGEEKKIGCVVDMGKDSVVKYCQDRCKSPEQRFVS